MAIDETGEWIGNRGKQTMAASRPCRWGVVLAGGEGSRLRELTDLICGDRRPKQFCPLIGDATLLEQTRSRVEGVIPRDRILVSLTMDHRPFFAAVPDMQRIVQPTNKGTAPPILHALESIVRMDAGASVAILPCDHHYSDDEAFTEALESAFGVAEAQPQAIVLLGAPAQTPETEYGWIETEDPAAPEPWFRVRRFYEKPSLSLARTLLRQGAYWNTFVMVGRAEAFLAMIFDALPTLEGAFEEAPLWNGSEVHIPDCVYRKIGAVNFSHEVLARQARRLMALPLRNSLWSDLGHPERVMAVLRSTGLDPWWRRQWERARKRKPQRINPTPACMPATA